jgi:hypothetical protein
MMPKGQTHIRRFFFSIYIISNKVQIGYSTTLIIRIEEERLLVLN